MAGWEVRLKPEGTARFGGAAFLAVWLAFWAVGEVLVIGILAQGGWALFTGQPPAAGRELLPTAPALLAGVFMLAWLAFWTLGGLMAWQELFRLIWSSDRILARGDGLDLVRQVGFFRSRQFLPRDRLRRIHRVDTGPAVQAETTDGAVELTRNGHPQQQAELVARLTAELRLPPPAELLPMLPGTWRVIAAPEGGEILVSNPATRRRQVRVAWILTLTLVLLTLVVIREALLQPSLWVVTLMLASLVGLVLWNTVRLTWGRDEWRLENQRLILQRRWIARTQERFTGQALELSETTDSDGDISFHLKVRADTGQPRTLKSSLNECLELRQLGEWLARRTGLPLHDQTQPEHRARLAAEVETRQAEQLRMLRDWWRELVGSVTGRN